MIGISKTTADRLDNIGQIILSIEEMQRLYSPLLPHVIRVRYTMDMAGIPREGRVIDLSANDWPDQFRAGVDRIAGLDIKWVE